MPVCILTEIFVVVASFTPHMIIISRIQSINSFTRYLGYRKDQKNDELPVVTETIMAFFCLMQCILLGTFAAILGAHRSEILEKQEESAPRIGQDSFGETPYTRSWGTEDSWLVWIGLSTMYVKLTRLITFTIKNDYFRCPFCIWISAFTKRKNVSWYWI